MLPLKSWNLAGSSLETLSDHVSLVNDRYILKFYQDVSTAQKVLCLADGLQAHGVISPQPLTNCQGNRLLPWKDGVLALFPRIPGEHPDLHSQPHLLTEAGRAIALVHAGLRQLDCPFPLFHMDLPSDLRGWIQEALRDNPLPTALADALSPLWYDLPTQIIHRDMHTKNLLFQNGRFCAILDLDLCVYGPSCFDLAYFLSSLASEGTEGESLKRACNNLLQGYGTLSSLEERALPLLAQGIELLFAAFWMNAGETGRADDSLRTMEILRCALN